MKMERRFFYSIPKLHEIKGHENKDLTAKWVEFVEERRKILSTMDNIERLYDELMELIPKPEYKGGCNFYIGEGGGNRCRMSVTKNGRCSRHAVRVESRYPALCQNIRGGSRCLYELDEKKYCELCKDTDGHCHKIIRDSPRWYRCPGKIVDGLCDCHERPEGFCGNILRYKVNKKGRRVPIICGIKLREDKCPLCEGNTIPKPWWWVDG